MAEADNVPSVFSENNMIEFAVMALDVSVVVADPDSVTNPAEAVDAVVALIKTLDAAPLSVRFPVVAVNPVPDVTVPGNDGEDGIDSVIVEPDAEVVISFAVPAIFTLPEVGVAVPVSPVNERKADAPDSNSVQVGVVTPAEVETEVRI